MQEGKRRELEAKLDQLISRKEIDEGSFIDDFQTKTQTISSSIHEAASTYQLHRAAESEQLGRMLDDAEYPERAARIRAEMLARDTGAAGAAGLLERAARLRLDEAAERDGWACLSASSAAGGTEAHHLPPVLGEPSSDGTLIWKVLGEPSSDGEAESQAGWADDLD